MAVITDEIAERTAGAGVTVDGLLIKDGALPDVTPGDIGAEVAGAAATAVSDHEIAYDHANIPSVDEAFALAAYQSALAAAATGQVLTASGPGAAAFAAAAGGPSLSDYSNVVVVDAGGAGDYTTLAAAMASITDATDTNRYVIIMMPGFYLIPNDAGFEISKNGVDIWAYPNTVTMTSEGTSYTNGLVYVGLANAMTSFSRIKNINFVVEQFNYGSAGLLLKILHNANTRAKFINCRFVSDGGDIIDTSATENTNTLVMFEKCHIESQLTSYNIPLRMRARLGVRLDDTTIVCSNALANSAPIRVYSVAAGELLTVKRSQLIGGEYGIKCAVAATTFPVMYTAFSVAPDANFVNAIATPYNVIDGDVADFL